jgi:hypothetical protein
MNLKLTDLDLAEGGHTNSYLEMSPELAIQNANGIFANVFRSSACAALDGSSKCSGAVNIWNVDACKLFPSTTRN